MRAFVKLNVTKFDHTFVGLKLPFIGSQKPYEMPFICKYAPLGRNSGYGFTLIELMVTLAVVALLVTVAIPNMRTIILNNRLATQANDLISDVSIARSASYTHRPSNVVMCASTTTTACTGGGWNSGRLIFVDNPPYNNTPDPQELVIRFHEPLSGSVETGPGTNLPDPLVFNAARGYPLDTLGQPIGPRQFVLCDTERRVYGRFLTLTSTGALSVTQTQTCP